MATKNDVTGDSIISKRNTNKYRDNWDRIFNKSYNDECENRRNTERNQKKQQDN